MNRSQRHVCALFILTAVITPSYSDASGYEWLRSTVNKFWYNQFVGNCKDNAEVLKSSLSSTAAVSHCSNAPKELLSNQSLSTKLVSKMYFDEALVEQARQNQCQFNYWSALNTKDSNAYAEQESANRILRGQFQGQNDGFKSHKFSDRANFFASPTNTELPQTQAQAAQSKIVDRLVESANDIVQKRRELKIFMATNSMYPVDPKLNPKEKIEKLTNEIAVLENGFIFSEDKEVSNFVKYQIVPKLEESYTLGQTPDLAELKSYFTKDKRQSFQSQVVERKLDSISEEQKNYAEINGKYDDFYSFKVSTIQSGVGAKILEKKSNQIPGFAKVQCELDSKYGRGEEIASMANSVVIGGVTFIFGGASLTLARLAQIGMATQRSARIGQVISGAVSTSISAGEIVKSVVESCSQSHFQKKDISICTRVEALKTTGLALQLSSEIDHSQCLTDLGLAALAGATAFKNLATAKRLKRDQQILELGIREKYTSLTAQIKSDSRLIASEKKQLLSELDRSISLSSLDGFPRKEFIESLSKESPQELLEAMKQINNNTAGATWSARVKGWISGKNLKKDEAEALESCMIESANKTSSCRFSTAISDS